MRDIDVITERVKQQIQAVEVYQYHKTHPADDDGVWWFSLPDVEPDIKLDSPNGYCPFMIETNEQWGENARTANDVNQAILIIVDYLKSALS
jgi:hypothetical protein